MAATDSPSTQRPTRSSPTRSRRLALGAATGVLALSLLAACSSGATSTSTAPAGGSSVAPAATAAGSSTAGPAGSSGGSSSAMPDSAAMIHISSFKYTVPASVAPGSTISVMNMDGENHTVTADSANAFDVVATAGQTVTFTAPKTPGSYPFHCTYHSNMHGILVVK